MGRGIRLFRDIYYFHDLFLEFAIGILVYDFLSVHNFIIFEQVENTYERALLHITSSHRKVISDDIHPDSSLPPHNTMLTDDA